MAAKGVGSTPGAPAMDSTSGSSDDVIITVKHYDRENKVDITILNDTG